MRTQRKRQDQRQTYDLSRAEMVAEIRSLRAEGWHDWEISERFDLSVLREEATDD